MPRIAGNLVRLRSAADAEISMLRPMGTVPGVRFVLIGGANGPGRGFLRCDGSGNLYWRAPGSATWGAAVAVAAGGTFWLFDGDDVDAFVQISVTAAYLPTAAWETPVELFDRYNTALSGSDDEAGAGAGSWTVKIYNGHAAQVDNITMWLEADEPTSRTCTLNPAAAGAVCPLTEAEGVAQFGEHDLGAGLSLSVEITRTPEAAAHHSKLLKLHLAWDDGEGGRAYATLRSRYRIYTSGKYEAHVRTGSPPDPELDTPVAEVTTLPTTPADTYGDGTHFAAVVPRNRFGLKAHGGYAERIDVAGGVRVYVPVGPLAGTVQGREDGYVRVNVLARRGLDSTRQPDEIGIWYTTNGGDPVVSGDPDISRTPTWRGAGRQDVWVCDDIPQQVHGTVVKVAIATLKAGVICDADERISGSHTVDTSGPAAPDAGEAG